MTIISAKASSSSVAAAPRKGTAIDASSIKAPRAAPKPSAKAPKLVAALAAAAVAAFSPAAPAFAGPDLVLGAKVFSNTCATCHSGGQNILEADKTLEREALEQYLAGGFSEASIVKQVTNGKGAMPAWGGQLSSEEINAVAAYVFDQASGDKW